MSSGFPYGLLLTRIFDWYGVDLVDVDKQCVKEFLDLKSLQQSNLKLEKDVTISQVEISSPTSLTGFDQANSVFDAKQADVIGQIRSDQLVLSRKLDDVLNEIKFLRDLVIGPRTPASARIAPSADVMNQLSMTWMMPPPSKLKQRILETM